MSKIKELEDRIKFLEDKFTPEYLLSYHQNDIHDILINVDEKLVDRIKAIENIIEVKK